MRLVLSIALLALAGCALSPQQKRIVGVAAVVLVAGAIVARDDGPTVPNVPTPSVDCSSNPALCR